MIEAMQTILIVVLKVMGVGIGIVIFLFVIGWLKAKLEAATKNIRAGIDASHPNYEVSIYRTNGDLAAREVVGFSDAMDVRDNLKRHYYCEIKAVIDD